METLVLSRLKVSVLRTIVIISYQIEKNRQKENNAIINNVVYEILINKTQKVSAEKEAPEFLESDYDDNDLYQAENESWRDQRKICLT